MRLFLCASFTVILLAAEVVLSSESPPQNRAPALGVYHIDSRQISFSGVSSGAHMAVQMQVAHSSWVQGAASVAGGVYACAEGNAIRAQSACMKNPERVRPENLIRMAREWEAEGWIDPLQGLSSQRVLLFSGERDRVVLPEQSEKLEEFYLEFLPASQLIHERSQEAGHGFPTLSQGAACSPGAAPWLLNCGTDLAERILRSFYPLSQPKALAVEASLQRFSQEVFSPEGWMADEAWIYVPRDCEKGALCGLHVALHGCQMGGEFLRDQFVRGVGYNEWAENNRVIVLYPQSRRVARVNPSGCWDWFGFTGEDYARQSGAQMRSLEAMIRHLSGGAIKGGLQKPKESKPNPSKNTR